MIARCWIIICVAVLLSQTFLRSQEHQSYFPPEEFKERWEKFFDRVDDGIENLTRFAPSDLDETAEITGKNGMIQAYPPLLKPLDLFEGV